MVTIGHSTYTTKNTAFSTCWSDSFLPLRVILGVMLRFLGNTRTTPKVSSKPPDRENHKRIMHFEGMAGELIHLGLYLEVVLNDSTWGVSYFKEWHFENYLCRHWLRGSWLDGIRVLNPEQFIIFHIVNTRLPGHLRIEIATFRSGPNLL